MFNASGTNDNLIKQHTSEPYVTKGKKQVTEEQNTIVVSKKKHQTSWFQKIKDFFQKNK